MNILIDVGACKGVFTESWLQKNPGGKAICVEPNPDNAKLLREKFANHPVDVIEKAAWTTTSVQDFWPGSTSENGSLTVRNESQIGAFAEETQKPSMSIECVKVSDLIGQATQGFDKSFVTLKLDVEGVEFRCLRQLVNSGLWPDVIYLEDGCRKCLDAREWAARIDFFNAVIDNDTADRIFIEANTRAHSDYMKCYIPIEEHKQFQYAKSNQFNLSLHDLESFIELCFKNQPDLYEKTHTMEFIFTWLTCHEVKVTLKTGENLRHVAENPLNSTKDFDLVNRLIKSVKYTFSKPGVASVDFTFQSLEEHQKLIEAFLAENNKAGLL